MQNDIFSELIKDSSLMNMGEYISVTVKLLVSFIEGLVLGLERKIRQQSLGMRTVIIISVASTLLMILSNFFGEFYGSDPARIAAQVVSGIGFLGGGAIMRQGLNIRGLTSAATIWGAAALGLTVGAGLYIPSVITLALFMIALVVLEKIELRYFPAERTKILSIVFDNENIDIKKTHEIIKKQGLKILSSDFDLNIEKNRIEIRFSVRSPEETDVVALCEELKKVGTINEIKLSINDK